MLFAGSVFTTARHVVTKERQHAKARVVQHDVGLIRVAERFLDVFRGASNGRRAVGSDFRFNVDAVKDVAGQLAPEVFFEQIHVLLYMNRC